MTAKESRRSLLSTVDGKEPASIGPAIDGREPRGIGAEQASQLDSGGGRRAGEQNMCDTHTLEIGAMLGRRRTDQFATAIALEVNWHGATPRIEPDERLIVGRDNGRVRKVLNDRQQLGEVR